MAPNGISKNVKEIEKNHVDCKIFVWNEKRISAIIIHWTIFFLLLSVSNFSEKNRFVVKRASA